MQEPDFPQKEVTAPTEPNPEPIFPCADKILLPRCQCCGALVPLIKSAACVNEIASCMVCGHRNR
jgi:hypothetical protein